MSQVPWGTTQPCQNLRHLPPCVENTLVYTCRPHWESPAGRQTLLSVAAQAF